MPEEGVGDDEREQHLPAPHLPGGTKVEVHRRVEYASGGGVPDDEVRALFGFRTLRHGVGPETVLSILRHSVVSHPHRRGHLRDLVLLSAARWRARRRVGAADRMAVPQ